MITGRLLVSAMSLMSEQASRKAGFKHFLAQAIEAFFFFSFLSPDTSAAFSLTNAPFLPFRLSLVFILQHAYR